ncbi:MAG: T9SS type A sorting domain-containing protein, partial [Bacteroidota bacterium]|nr:T9SS type A sorting domain-containing protein [Bacteroidota bacterium]
IMPSDGFGSHSPADPLEWNAVGNATSYDVYFGTSSSPSFVTNITGTSYSPTLAESTTYYWKVVPKNAYGEPTGCAVWEFTTGAAPANGDYRTRFTDANWYGWNNSDNWEVFNGSSWNVATTLPGSTNNVLVQSGSQYVVLNNPMTATGTPATCENLRIEGTLQFWNGLDASTDAYGDLDIYGNLDIMPSGTLESFMNVTNIEAVSAINMVTGGDITNYGELMLYDEFNGASYTHAWITFYGSAESNLTLASGSSTRLFYIQLAKDNPSDIVNFNINEDFLAVNDEYSGNNGFLKSYNVNSWDETPTGHLKISGSYSKNNPVWFMGLTTYSLLFTTSDGIASNLTVEIDNPNFGVMAQNVTFNLAGKLIVSQGQCDIGATSGNVGGVDQSQYYLNILNGGHLEISGGTLNTRAGVAGNGTHYFTMTDGYVNVGRNANASSRGLFDLQENPQVTISGGKITMTDYRYVSNNTAYRVDNGNINITGGTLQIGTSLTPPLTNGESFSIQGPTPSIELYTDGSTITNNAIMWDDVQCYGNLDIPEYCGLSIYDQDSGDIPHTFSITGDINHEGNIWAEVENSKILFNGSSAQTFHTTGAYSDVLGEAGISIVEVDNPAGVQLTGLSTAVTKNFINTNGTFHIGDCSLGLSGIVTRTNGYIGGNSNSELYITGDGTLGNLYFDPTSENLNLLELDRQNTGIVSLATDLNISGSINFINGTLYTYRDNDINNESDTLYLASDAELIGESNNSYLYGAVSISNATYPQTLLTGPEPFDTDFLVHDINTVTTTDWYAPNYNTPIIHEASGGCPDGRIGYSGNWNNYWGNFVRLPETDFTGYDQISLTFDVSHSYFASQTDDWMRFYMWADGGYENNVVSVKIDGVDVTCDDPIPSNGTGFQYTEARSCASVEVIFDISAITDKTNILLYLEAYCKYNNGNEFYTYFDNISVSGVQSGTVSPDFGNVWAIMNNLNEDLGDITVTRVTGADGQMTISDATSIDCHWDIQTGNQPTTLVNMSFRWLDLFDNGLTTTEMLVYTLHDPNPWEDVGSPVSVSGNPRTISADANQFSKWTVAKKNEVLPVSLLYFNVQCNGHSKEFSWATASETNSDYFLIMESKDNVNFKPIGKIQAAGQSYQTKEYQYVVEGLSDDAYYRLKQVDFDGSSESFSMIYNSCEQDNKCEISVYPNPFDGSELNLLSSAYIGESQMNIYDTSGRLIRKMQYNLEKGRNAVRFENPLAPGAYLLKIQDNTSKYKPVQIIVR